MLISLTILERKFDHEKLWEKWQKKQIGQKSTLQLIDSRPVPPLKKNLNANFPYYFRREIWSWKNMRKITKKHDLCAVQG